ncbi:MAG: rhodanese [Bacteroidetes bacterium]|nr:MAG: rhodanese [Bacteroidota bacterium]
MLNSMYKHSVPLIKAQQLNQVLASDSTIVILDAREKKEYNVSHIKNARYVGFEDFNIESVRDLSKDTKIIVNCSVGYRSERIGEKLIKANYTNVSNLYGGIFSWVNHDYPVYTSDNRITNKVHAYSEKWSIWLKKGEKVYE